MKKVLQATTIIPSELYVHRDADRQLRRGLEEMGRPAYVLVARQMGKTNLLLNARRELQQDGDAFVYIDLSNTFSTLRDCFRNVTDAAIDAYPGQFADVNGDIQQLRNRSLQPHKEHEIELRRLLQHLRGKLVIILDEIDALTTSPFSDQVFAQIRSTYFSRVNIPEYARLTYVLSGVAEPSELIKNPKLSPFNIGEKIYLDDFTESEFADFLQRACLSLAGDVTSRVFHWLSGNPRMTWDVCSEIEDLTMAGRPISVGDVDAIVEKLYLAQFDRTPVDHIRSLVESSPELRNALVELRYGKGASISDSVRNKLYLAGIIGSRRDATKVRNPVIDRSLSDQWLREVDRKKLGLLGVAETHLSSGRYRDAIEALNEYLKQPSTSPVDRATAKDTLSRAFYSLKQYREAIDCVQGEMFDKLQYPALYFSQRYRQAICLFRLGSFLDSIEIFEDIRDHSPEPALQLKAKINIAASLVRSGDEARREEVPSLLRDVVETLQRGVPDLVQRDSDALAIVARYNLSTVYLRAGDADRAVAELEAALRVATRRESISLLVALARCVDSTSRQAELITSAVDIVIADGISPAPSPMDTQLDVTEATFGDLLSAAFAVDPTGLCERLLRYCVNADIAAGAVPFSASYQMLVSSVVSSGPDALSHVASVLSGATADLDAAKDHAYVFAKIVASYATRRANFASHVTRYLRLLGDRARALDETDLHILGRQAAEFINQGRLQELARMLREVERHRTMSSVELFLILDYYGMVLAGSVGDLELERRLARAILDVVKSGGEVPLSDADLRLVRDSAETALHAGPRPVTVTRKERKFGRNEKVTVRYVDGTLRTVKYKHVEVDIRTGACTIIARAD